LLRYLRRNTSEDFWLNRVKDAFISNFFYILTNAPKSQLSILNLIFYVIFQAEIALSSARSNESQPTLDFPRLDLVLLVTCSYSLQMLPIVFRLVNQMQSFCQSRLQGKIKFADFHFLSLFPQ